MPAAVLRAEPAGVMLNATLVARRNVFDERAQMLLKAAYGAACTPRASSYVQRATALMKDLSDTAWGDRTPHPTHQVPLLARVQMLLALSGLKEVSVERLVLLKQIEAELAKGTPVSHLLKALDDENDEDDDSESEDENDTDDDDSDDDDDFNAKHPRWPAGAPDGTGGEFKAKDDIYTSEYQAAANDGTPGNNQAQNKQFNDIVRILKLNDDQAEQLHYAITGRNMGFHEILQEGRDLFNK